MDDQNTPTPEPVTVEPAATEPTAPAVEQIPQTEAVAEVPPAPPETPTAQLVGNEPFADPASAGGGESTQSIGVVEATQSPSTSALAEPKPVSQPLPMPAQAPVIVVQNRIKDFFAKAAQAIQFRKQKKLAKIMGLFLKKTHITNDEVEKLLHVSDATATRYLSQLEKQGKIKQSAKTGKGVTYTKIQ